MISIRFEDIESKREALGFVTGRFGFKSWANGEMVVPELALPHLAVNGIRFTVQGPVRYQQLIPSPRRNATAEGNSSS
jgi:hypothetical protein